MTETSKVRESSGSLMAGQASGVVDAWKPYRLSKRDHSSS
jgi:hypothetical protein